MTIRDVLPTSDFYADLRQQLDPSGTTGVPRVPTRDQFDACEMPSILHAFATGWDQLPERFQGNPRYRMLIRTGLLVAAYAVTGELLPDGRIALVALRIDPGPPDEAFLDDPDVDPDERRG